MRLHLLFSSIALRNLHFPMQNIFSRITWRPSRKLIVSLGIICLILGGAYVWASRQIDAMRMNNVRNDNLAYYAGCEKLSPSGVDKDIVNEYWRINSQESHFTHADVAEYMMKHCPPKSDAQIETVNSEQYIEGAKSVRDYQLKFLNKDLDVFRQ